MKKRPYVTISKENRSVELLHQLQVHLPIFKDYEGVVGIVLDGGISRGYADDLSEIDVVIYLDELHFTYYQENITPTGQGITVIDDYLYDIKLCCYEDELKKVYDNVGLWDMSYAKILYDPEGKIKELFTEKLKTIPNYDEAQGYLFDSWWHYRLATDIWIHREDYVQGHYMLNAAIEPLISALYIVNKEYVPHEKWILHLSHTLSWIPTDYDSLLVRCMGTGNLSRQSLIDRQMAIETLWRTIDAKFCEFVSVPKGIHFMQYGCYQSLYEFYKRPKQQLTEWLTKHTLSELNYEPLHTLVSIKENQILLDMNRIKTLNDKELDSWFLQVVKALQ